MISFKNYSPSDFKSIPVDILTFIKDPQYLGKTNQSNIYPYWVKTLSDIYPSGLESPYNDIVLTGALGTGRTSIALVGFLYDLYRLTLLENPQGKWGLIPTTPIVMSIISLYPEHNLISDMLLDILNESPYFKSIMLPGIGDRLESGMFANIIGIEVHTRKEDLIGKAVIGSIVDDSCVCDNTSDADIDNLIDLYTFTNRRSITRFVDKNGDMPVHMWVTSYATSRLERLVDAVRFCPKVAVISPAVWEVMAHKGLYKGDYFYVYVGTTLSEPKILDDVSEDNLQDKNFMSTVIKVPEEYRDVFEASIDNGLGELAGIIPPHKTQNNTVTFNVSCTMKKRWADEFVSFLKHMEFLGNAGCSRVVAFYADGDGDFRPKFSTNLVDAKITEPTKTLEGGFTLFDAG